MSPYQHGEVYVTEDGAETDLDLGHYERFIDEDLNRFSNLTTGRVYWNVLNKERRGNISAARCRSSPTSRTRSRNSSTAWAPRRRGRGDNGNRRHGGRHRVPALLEAIRQVGREQGRGNALYIHVTLVPYLKASGEHKTKPTQHSVKELQGLGISPDIIVLRCDEPITERGVFDKIAGFCNVERGCVIENVTLPCLYAAPLMLEREGLAEAVCRNLELDVPAPDLAAWKALVERINSRSKRVRVALVGKYVQLHDAYLSVVEALNHAGYELGAEVELDWVDSETLTAENAAERLAAADGVLVPGGFGGRGVEGMVLAAPVRPRARRALSGPLPGDAGGGHRVRAARPRLGGRRLRRVRAGERAQGDRFHARPERRGGQGRHAAPGRLALRDIPGHGAGALLRRAGDKRAAPPPL